MGIYDRDYYRNTPRRGFGMFSMWSVTTWLIVLNIVVFFADGMIKRAAVDRVMREEGKRALTMDQDEFERQQDGADDRMMALMMARGPLEKWGYFSVEKAIYHG